MKKWIAALLLLIGTAGMYLSQVNVGVIPVPKAQFLDNNGIPVANGYVCTYAAGTTTPQSTYTDYTGSVTNTNPVVLDSAGRANIWLAAQSYKIVLYSAPNTNSCPGTGAQIWSVDGISGSASYLPITGGTVTGSVTFGNGLVMSSGTATFQGPVNISGANFLFGMVRDSAQPAYSVMTYGNTTTCNGVQDDTAAINAAIASAAPGGDVQFPAKGCRITSPITITTAARLRGFGLAVSTLTYTQSTGTAITFNVPRPTYSEYSGIVGLGLTGSGGTATGVTFGGQAFILRDSTIQNFGTGLATTVGTGVIGLGIQNVLFQNNTTNASLLASSENIYGDKVTWSHGGSESPIVIDSQGGSYQTDFTCTGCSFDGAPITVTNGRVHIDGGHFEDTVASNVGYFATVGDGSTRSMMDIAGSTLNIDSAMKFSGTVNTVGTAVTWVSGDIFPTTGAWTNPAGATIKINNVNYQVSTVNSTTSITLVATAGNQTGVAYSVVSPTFFHVKGQSFLSVSRLKPCTPVNFYTIANLDTNATGYLDDLQTANCGGFAYHPYPWMGPGAGYQSIHPSIQGEVLVGRLPIMTYAQMTFGTPGNANLQGSILYCSDCNATCTAGGGGGRVCFFEGAAWTH